MNPSTAFAAVFADELARCGLREVVIAPGSRSTPLAMAFWGLERAGRVRLHVRIDERSASFTALGLAKASRRPVAVLCTSGTAAANFHPAVIEADESAVPLLVLTADRPPELRATGASQTIDQVKLYGSAVRWYAESGVPEYEAVPYYTISVSSKVPAEVVRKLNADLDSVLKQRELTPRWAELGITPLGGSPDAAVKRNSAETETWTKVIKSAGIRAD